MTNSNFPLLDKKTLKFVKSFQQDEINSHIIYKKLSIRVKDTHNSEILTKISDDELKHYEFWKTVTKKELKPQKLKVWFYFIISTIFGLTFGIRLMERGEIDAQEAYKKVGHIFPEIETIIEEEERHENQLIDMLNEELLDYVGSVVLGLSDALVELTGALAGFTLALQKTNLIALAGFIAGVSAAFSMAASEYLSSSEEEDDKDPLKAAFYTGISYFITVIILITPYLLLINYDPIIPLLVSLISAVIIIFIFTFYISVAKNLPFKKRFLKISSISL
ncbi:MAG: VIT1/CCC1 transporter family protein, partial [Candidatus Hodarchaeales archaeon]